MPVPKPVPVAPKCASGCSGHGRCGALSGRCECDRGWEGPLCERPACTHGCHGNGVCEGGKCACSVGFRGDSCAEVDPISLPYAVAQARLELN